jgi:hypothetical protein
MTKDYCFQCGSWAYIDDAFSSAAAATTGPGQARLRQISTPDQIRLTSDPPARCAQIVPGRR